jgi:hypothetical protein
MKTLLAILLSFIVTEAPVLAIHGGYTLGGASSATGTYAGVLIPTSSVSNGAAINFGSNSLGLFTLNIPSTGVGNGSVVIFSGAVQTVGTIDALPDPNNVGGIIGVLQAQDLETVFSDTGILGIFGVTQQQIVAEASGSLTASTSNNAISNSPTGVNLSGTSVVTFSTPNATTGILTATEQVTFAVEGFQQSSTSTATSGTF